MPWLNGHEHINLDTGLSYTGAPGKLIWHTMEGSIESCINTFKNDPSKASHLAWSWQKNRKVQFINTDNSAKSLRNLSGGVETNRDRAYQIELEGSWAESENWPEHAWKWLGEALADLWLQIGRDFALEWGWKPLVGPDDGFTARVNAPQRYTAAEYDNANFMMGHCNVPENDHTDPGPLNKGKILYYCHKKLEPFAPEEPEEEEMPLELCFAYGGHVVYSPSSNIATILDRIEEVKLFQYVAATDP